MNQPSSNAMPRLPPSRFSKQSGIKLFISIYLLIATILTILFYGLMQIDTKLDLISLREHEIAQAQVTAQLLAYDNQEEVTELSIMSHAPSFKRYLDNSSLDEKNRITLFLDNLLEAKKIYDHITLLDLHGHEIIKAYRADGKVIIAAPSNLISDQNQSYFKDLGNIPDHQIYISPFNYTNAIHATNADDLFVYFGTPIFDEQGIKKGYVILTLSGKQLLKDFNAAMPGKHVPMLVSENGTWLNYNSLMNKKELALHDTSQLSVANPHLWDTIKRNDRGFIQNSAGLFSFASIYPLISSDPSSDEHSISIMHTSNNLTNKQFFWKIIAFVPKSDLPHPSFVSHRTVFAIYTLSLALLSILVFYMTKNLLARKEYAEALRNNILEYEDLYDYAPVAYHSLDSNGTFIRINKTELKWIGYTKQEVLGKMRFADLLVGKSLNKFNELFPKFKSQGQVHDIEYEIRRKDGTFFSALLSATALYDSQGQYIMSRSTMIDITRRTQVEYALRESEARFRNAMENAPIGMALTSLDGHFRRVNRKLCDLVGYDKEQLEQMTFQQITYYADLKKDLEKVSELLEGKTNHYQIEKRYVRKNGTIVWVQLTASLLRDSDSNAPLYFITQVEEISERKRHQEKIHRLAYHDPLTDLPNRRLLLDRLNQAITLAQHSNEALAVLYLDLDKFKDINDNLGHDIGDELLNIIAARLVNEVRESDTIARSGGDEFIILLNPIANLSAAEHLAAKIISAITIPIYIRDNELSITASIGIAIYPLDGNTSKQLIKNADTAMYTAKNSGSNKYFSFQKVASVNQQTFTFNQK